MSINPHLVNWVLRRVFQPLCRIDVQGFKKIPRNGPYIMVGNHINSIEVPVVVAHIDNPNMIGVAKRESWKNPLFRFLFNTWGVIPIDRNLIDREAFRRSVEVLSEGKILVISPEGTRSISGKLQQAKPGVVALAVRSQAPLVPVAFYGYENVWSEAKRLRRVEFHVAVGKPFRLELSGEALSREARQTAADEIMYKIAELLPEYYRGFYAFEGKVEYRYAIDL